MVLVSTEKIKKKKKIALVSDVTDKPFFFLLFCYRQRIRVHNISGGVDKKLHRLVSMENMYKENFPL